MLGGSKPQGFRGNSLHYWKDLADFKKNDSFLGIEPKIFVFFIPENNSVLHKTPQHLKLAMSLLRLTRLYHARLNNTASEYRLTADQILTLHMLAQAKKPMTVTEISQKSPVNQPAVSKMVKIFESGGYIRRFRISNDKRKTHIEISDLGRSLVGEVQNRIARQILPYLATLDAKSLTTLESASTQLSEKLSAKFR